MTSSLGHERRTPAGRTAAAAALIALGVAAIGAMITLGATTAVAAKIPYQVQSVKVANTTQTTARWNPCQSAIVWRTNLKGLSAAQQPAVLAELKRGFTQLAAADGMTYRYAGDTTFVPTQEDMVSAPADIVVAVVSPSATDFDFSGNSLGYGGVIWATWYGDSGSGAAVVRGYVILIPSGLSVLKPGFGPGKTQGDLILHELGHTTGLLHVPDPAEQMYPTLTADSPNGYAPGDLAGLAKLGAAGGCITIPARVNITDYS